MTEAAQKEIVQQAFALPKKVREWLGRQLLESVDPAEEKISRKEWSRLWKAELEKRIADIDSGKVKCIPHAEVRKKLDRILRKA